MVFWKLKWLSCFKEEWRTTIQMNRTRKSCWFLVIIVSCSETMRKQAPSTQENIWFHGWAITELWLTGLWKCQSTALVVKYSVWIIFSSGMLMKYHLTLITMSRVQLTQTWHCCDVASVCDQVTEWDQGYPLQTFMCWLSDYGIWDVRYAQVKT